LVVAFVAFVVASLAAGSAIGATPARFDSALTAYVRNHQPWVPLQARAVERFSDGDPADTSFSVFTTIRPYTDQVEAVRVCVAVADDLRALGLPLSLSVLGRPEATMAWDSSHHSCSAPVPAALAATTRPAAPARVAAVIESELATPESQLGLNATAVRCQASALSARTSAGMPRDYTCSFSAATTTWRCTTRPTAATLAGYKTAGGLGVLTCMHPAR
jgi:hypothetical protein